MKTMKFQLFDSCGVGAHWSHATSSTTLSGIKTPRQEPDYHQQLNRIAKESMF